MGSRNPKQIYSIPRWSGMWWVFLWDIKASSKYLLSTVLVTPSIFPKQHGVSLREAWFKLDSACDFLPPSPFRMDWGNYAVVDRSSKTVVMFSRIYDKVHHQLCREEAGHTQITQVCHLENVIPWNLHCKFSLSKKIKRLGRNCSSPDFLKANDEEEKLETLWKICRIPIPLWHLTPHASGRCSSCTASSNSIAIADCGEQREKDVHVVVVINLRCMPFIPKLLKHGLYVQSVTWALRQAGPLWLEMQAPSTCRQGQGRWAKFLSLPLLFLIDGRNHIQSLHSSSPKNRRFVEEVWNDSQKHNLQRGLAGDLSKPNDVTKVYSRINYCLMLQFIAAILTEQYRRKLFSYLFCL